MPPLLLPSRNRTTAELQQTVTLVGVGAAVVLAAVVYFTLRAAAPRHIEEPAQRPVSTAQVPAAPSDSNLASIGDDLSLHIANVRADSREATERLKTAQVLLGGVRGSLDVNYMEGPKRQVERADALTRDAFRLLQQGLDELDQADRLAKKVR